MDDWIRMLFDVVAVALAAGVFAAVVRSLALSVHVVRSTSMEPALRVGDRVCVLRRGALTRPPKCGDIVVVKAPSEDGGSRREVIKRVLWTTSMADDPTSGRSRHIRRRSLSQDSRLFIAGDNRTVSRDSRHYGPVSGNDLVGLAICVVWPLGRASSIGRLGRMGGG